LEQHHIEQLLRIDDLAHQSGVPGRTIRFYNTQGLLPMPIMRGRVAYYTQEHLQVLNIIKELQEQQHLPLEIIKQLLEIRAKQGDIDMNLALKQRLLRPLTGSDQHVPLSIEDVMQQTGASREQIDELTRQELIFPVASAENTIFSGDDVLLIHLYFRLEQLGLPVALPALMRFQMRQLVRSEIAAFEQHLLPHLRENDVPIEEQTRQFEEMLTLTDTLISILHRKLLYQST
jgi:DNA-binding transcriptional MerR regulator